MTSNIEYFYQPYKYTVTKTLNVYNKNRFEFVKE